MELWAGCIAGALSEDEYFGKLRDAGFRDVGLEVTRDYDAGDLGVPGGAFVSAFVRASKPR